MKAALRGLLCFLGGNDEVAVFGGDSYLLIGQEPGVFDPATRELDSGVKLQRFVQVCKVLIVDPEQLAEPRGIRLLSCIRTEISPRAE